MKLLTAVPAPFLEDNVDTDVIFPARFLLLLERDGLAKYAFFERRTADPDFVLGRPPYSGTSILVAGNNFGTGSSREQAVWSLADLGIRCVIARSFGEIFHANCFRNGMVPILCDGPDMARIEADADAGREISVDLEAQEILSSGGPPIRFEISPHRKAALMSGLDEVGQILKENLADIEAYETRAAGHDPWTVIPAARYEALRAEMTEPVADTP